MYTVISKDGTTIAYDRIGNGPALLYITGATCFRNFRPVKDGANVFAEAFTVYNYDRRGRGDSTDNVTYSIDKEVEDLEALIDVSNTKPIIYGHSSGAVIALEAAMKLGNKIEGVVIYDASYVHNEKERKEYQQLSNAVSELLHRRKYGKAITYFLTGIGMPKIFAFLLPFLPGWKTMKALAPTLRYDIMLTKDLPPLDRIKYIRVPISVIVGQKSPEALHSVAEQITKVLTGTQVTLLAGQDHLVDPKKLLPLLKNFSEVRKRFA